MKTPPLKIGLIGCGKVAEYGHLPAIVQLPGLSLHAVLDPSEQALQQAQRNFDVPNVFTEADDFFCSGLDAVTVTSPAPFHYHNVLDAARYRLPVLCEKPIAMNRREADEMSTAMREAGTSFYAGFCYRFSPSALQIRRLVHEGAIGEVRSLRLIYNWNLHGKYETEPDGKKRLQRRRVERMLEGGPMVDCGTHQIDLAHFWLDSPVDHFSGFGAWLDDYEAPDHMYLHMVHASGAHTMVEISYSYMYTAEEPRSEFVYELIGTKGVIRYDRSARECFMATEHGTSPIPFHSEKNFAGMYCEWESALRTGKSSLLASPEHATRVTEIAREATKQASNKGHAHNVTRMLHESEL